MIEFKKFKLFTVCLLAVLNNNMFADFWTKIDSWEADYFEARKYIVRNDKQFIDKGQDILRALGRYHYEKEIIALDQAGLEGLEQLFEQVIHEQSFFGYYTYIRLRDGTMRELNLYAQKLKNILSYRPKKTNTVMADIHQKLVDRQAKLALLINWVTPTRIALYEKAHAIRYSILTHEIKHNINDPILLRHAIYEHIVCNHESYRSKEQEVAGTEFFNDYLNQIRISRADLQKVLTFFLKADQWHATPLYIENLLADLDYIEHRILADQNLDVVPNWTTQERFDLHQIAKQMLNYKYENELRIYFKNYQCDCYDIAKAILKNYKINQRSQNGIAIYASKVQQDLALLQIAIDKYLASNRCLPTSIQTLNRGLNYIHTIATDKVYGSCFYEDVK